MQDDATDVNGLDVSSSGYLSNGDVFDTYTRGTGGIRRCAIADSNSPQYYENSEFITASGGSGHGYKMYVDDDISVSTTLSSSDKETRPSNIAYIIWRRTA